jgi:carbamoyl-phosphate synthase small subunit
MNLRDRKRPPALLVLEDGGVFPGHAFAGAGETCGEVVFNTGMTGYQEVITDPSYKGQIVTMTYPHVGNYGINPEDMESGGIHLEGFIVKEYHPQPSNWRSRRNLREFLEEHGKIGIAGLDTRALTRRLRLAGAMKGIISTETADVPSLLEKVRDYPGLVGRDLVREVACRIPYLWKNGVRREISAAPGKGRFGSPAPMWGVSPPPGKSAAASGTAPTVAHAAAGEGNRAGKKNASPPSGPPTASPIRGGVSAAVHLPAARPRRVVVIDCGVKYNILRHLEDRGCEVIVLPAATLGAEILSWRPDGILFSNGPGDPAALPYLVAAAAHVLGKVPVFGICLGHQIIAQAAGGRTEKLKFGHHGLNQPVKNGRTGRIEITSQNHGFVVLPESVARRGEATHGNLNDRTSEGIFYPELRAFSVQYHPEAAPGPHDAAYLFDRFVEMTDENPSLF